MTGLSLQERTALRKQRQAAQQRQDDTRSSSPPPQTPGFPTRLPNLNITGITPNPFTSGTSSNATVSSSIATRRLMGDRIRKKVKLEPSSEAEFTQFIETTSSEEREALLHASILRLTDLHATSAQAKASNYTPSKTLEKSLRSIIHTALLMPNIKYYSGNLSSIIMTVAETNVKQMPKDDDEQDALASWLNKEINNARYQIKKTIAESLNPGNELKNIAVLTDRLFSKLGKDFKPTLSVYMRLAFIRAEIAKNHKADKFWGIVDDELEGMHKHGPAGFVDDLTTVYEEDVENHGDPANSKCAPSTEMVGDKKPRWYQSLHDNVSKIQRIKARIAATKRKRGDDGEEDEEDDSREPADNGGEDGPSEDQENDDPNGRGGQEEDQ
ncbi:hypothetical protein R3P38DRAFT_1580776 [Favolaschia claudopus]|uniref:Uncharacterized protein n=1 Tax=Favolaschia claudopus TaxID=2862362 RepID=A0AAW0AIR5_9AGAR